MAKFENLVSDLFYCAVDFFFYLNVKEMHEAQTGVSTEQRHRSTKCRKSKEPILSELPPSLDMQQRLQAFTGGKLQT